MAATEKHYTVREISELWGISDDSVRKIFAARPDVLKFSTPKIRKRKYVTLRVPESTLARVYNDLRAVRQ